jgi:hypothetical protein
MVGFIRRVCYSTKAGEQISRFFLKHHSTDPLKRKHFFLVSPFLYIFQKDFFGFYFNFVY